MSHLYLVESDCSTAVQVILFTTVRIGNYSSARVRLFNGSSQKSGLPLLNTKGEHIIDNHYGKHVICRVQKSLPSAKFRALGKDLLCRAPHSAKYGTWQRGLCRVPGTRQRPALGKGRHSAKIGRGLTASSGVLFAECPPFGTRQKKILVFCHQFFLKL